MGCVDLDKWELRWTVRKTKRSILVPVAGPLRDHLMALAASDDLSGYLHPEAYRNVFPVRQLIEIERPVWFTVSPSRIETAQAQDMEIRRHTAA